MIRVRAVEVIAIILIIVQCIALGVAFSLNPIMDQEKFGYLLAMSLILSAVLLYIYQHREDIFPEKILELDEEWVALAIAFSVLIVLFTIYM